MASETRKAKKILLKDLNSVLTCTLCSGYFVDATTLVDCLHVFCRGCILKHFENSKQGCPTCNKKKTCIRPDPQIQALVYKMVPGLFSRETQRREEFYRMTGVRASSSCSDDSVLGDLSKDREQWISSSVSDAVQFFSPDDSISLSLEYYQHHLDETNSKGSVSEVGEVRVKSASDKEERVRDRRYLQCPAAVSMSHLQKFLRMKYALSPEHKVDIIYEGEVLPTHYNLMDVAYTFNWTKVKPMRFFYRIFTPLKIQPIKIINTSSSTGAKQLQIVPIKPNSEQKLVDETQNDKERLMAHLKLQSRHKVQEAKETQTQTKTTEPNCVYEYEEPDKEEIKRFAENRDREWASMRHEEPETHHVKKRKKNKHSKSDATHKKKKLHAEITGEAKQELKLKVKLTPHNGHKHKHRIQIIDSPKEESKDKLLQMKALRHKSATPENVPKVDEEEKKVEDKEAQKTFLKTFQSNAEGTSKVPEKIQPVKTVEKAVEKRPINTYSNQKSHKSLEKKIATLQQQCTIEAKAEKKVTFSNEKPHILNSSQYPSGFTVSKIEPTLKRKAEEMEDKRPSLEITLIPTEPKPKRPPPATIPLERIKKSSKTGLSIIPKLPEKSDNNGPLDLSKPSKLDGNGITTLNGLKTINNFPKSNLSNLQMLSKVAAEQSLNKKLTPPSKISPINKAKAVAQSKPQVSKPQQVQKPVQVSKPPQAPAKATQNVAKPPQTAKPAQVSNKATTQTPNKTQVNSVQSIKPRPQIPNLQTIKVPNPQPQKPNLPKLPKLQEINKTHIRLLNSTQIRTMRPTQNQSVRNIPNPSLLVRQQNQNRLSLTPIQNGESKEPKILNSLAPVAKESAKEETPKLVENGVSAAAPNNVSKLIEK